MLVSYDLFCPFLYYFSPHLITPAFMSICHQLLYPSFPALGVYCPIHGTTYTKILDLEVVEYPLLFCMHYIQ